MLTFLEFEGISITVEQDELEHLGFFLADGSIDYDELLKWIKDNQN